MNYSGYSTNSVTNTDWLFRRIDSSKPVLIIKKNHLKSISTVDSYSIHDLRQVGSYNWSLKSKTHDPIIVIPGVPNYFKDINESPQLMKIKHVQIMDMDRHFLPEFSLEPIFRSVKECSPKFQLKNIDFVSDRSGLKKLFSFVDGSCVKGSFRIDLKRIGNLILLIRNDEIIMNFAEDYSKDFIKKFSINQFDYAHKKIVSYKIGNLSFLIRFEVDCVYNDEYILSENQINRNFDPTKFQDSKLSFIKQGSFKTNDKLVQMTTQAKYRNESYFGMKWVQGFFSQIDYLFIGIHAYGKIEKIEKLTLENVAEKCNKRKETIERSMNKLHDLLTKVKDLAMNPDNGPFMMSIVFEKEYDLDVIRVFKTENTMDVPNSLYKDILADLEL